MTNEEAISNLEHIYGIVSPDIQRSLDLAIKALEERPTGEWDKVTEAHEDIGYDRGFRDGYAQAVEERLCELENDEEGRNHEQRY